MEISVEVYLEIKIVNAKFYNGFSTVISKPTLWIGSFTLNWIIKPGNI